jgi:hypothetical protein
MAPYNPIPHVLELLKTEGSSLSFQFWTASSWDAYRTLGVFTTASEALTCWQQHPDETEFDSSPYYEVTVHVNLPDNENKYSFHSTQEQLQELANAGY